MKKSFTLLCSIFLIGSILNGCASGKASVSSAAMSQIFSAAQNSSASENQNITLEKDKISKDVVFRRGSAADGKVILTSGQIEKIVMEPSQMVPGSYAITFYLVKESCKQFAADTQKMAETKEKMSIWGKNGKITSAEISDSILGGSFVLQGAYNLQEAKQRINQFSA